MKPKEFTKTIVYDKSPYKKACEIISMLKKAMYDIDGDCSENIKKIALSLADDLIYFAESEISTDYFKEVKKNIKKIKV